MTEDRGQITNERQELRNEKQRGFSLIEIIITLVVLSIAAVGVLSVFSSTQSGSADPLLLNQAVQLAQERMDVIVGDRKNSTRGFAWVVAADYNTNPLKYLPENPVAGFANFNRNVNIFCVNAGALNTDNLQPLPCAAGYAHVTVTVTHATIGNVTADTVLANYGPF